MLDMKARDRMGARKYGLRHQSDNGRDHLVDAYQEVLDLALYIRAEIEKRKKRRAAARRRRALELVRARNRRPSDFESLHTPMR